MREDNLPDHQKNKGTIKGNEAFLRIISAQISISRTLEFLIQILKVHNSPEPHISQRTAHYKLLQCCEWLHEPVPTPRILCELPTVYHPEPGYADQVYNSEASAVGSMFENSPNERFD